MPMSVCKFNNLYWEQSKFLLVLQHEILPMASRVDFSSPVKSRVRHVLHVYWMFLCCLIGLNYLSQLS